MKVLIGTQNLGKIKEMKTLLAPLNVEIMTIYDFADYEAFHPQEETGETYYDNAMIKAKEYYEFFQVPIISDDSGLEVDVLDGAPGIRSARFLDEKASYHDKRQALIKALGSNIPAKAQFVACLVYYDGEEVITSFGTVQGSIIGEERGENGFGYDPIFYLPEFSKTMAELTDEEKNCISHRAKASRALWQKIINRRERENGKTGN